MSFIDYTQSHYTRQDASARVIGLTQRPLPDNAQHSQQTDIHASGRMRIRNTSKRAAVEPCLRPRDHLDRRIFPTHFKYVLEHNLKLLYRSHTCNYWLTNNTSVMHKHIRGLFHISLVYLKVSQTTAIKVSHARRHGFFIFFFNILNKSPQRVHAPPTFYLFTSFWHHCTWR